jgi:outer membrane protein TolC
MMTRGVTQGGSDVVWRVLLAAASVATLAGCAVDQEKEVGVYRAVIDAGEASTQPVTQPSTQPATQPTTQASTQPGADQALRVLPLKAALELTVVRSERLAAEGEAYLRAIVERDRAFSAFFPTVSLIPSLGYVDRSGVGSSSGKNPRVDVPLNTGYSDLSPVREIANFKSSEATILSRRSLLLDAKATLLLEVAQTYYQVLRSQKSVSVLENSSAVSDARVRDAKARQKAGVARPLDTAQAEAQAAGTRATLEDARRDVRTNRHTLARLVSAEVTESELTDEFRIPVPVPGMSELLERAQRQRQDVQAAIAELEARRQAVTSAFSQYYPSVSLDFDYYLSRQSLPTAEDWALLLRVNVPIFTAGKIHADVRLAWSDLRVAKLNELTTRRLVTEQVSNAYEQLAANEKKLVELQTQVAAATEALRLAEQSYQAGLSTNLDRLSAQDNLLTAELGLVNAQFDRKLYYLSLLRSVGDLGTQPGKLGQDLPSPPAPPDVRTPLP